MAHKERGCAPSIVVWIRAIVLLAAFAMLGVVALLSLRMFLAPPSPTPTPPLTLTASPPASPTTTLQPLPTVTPLPTNTPAPTNTAVPTSISVPLEIIEIRPLVITTPTMPRRATKPPEPVIATAAPPATPPAPSNYPYDFALTYQNNCGHEWVEGTVYDAHGQPLAGMRVEIDLYGNMMERTTGYHNRNVGYWEFILDDTKPGPRDLTFHIVLLAPSGQQLSERVQVHLTVDNCDNAAGRQVATVDFKKKE